MPVLPSYVPPSLSPPTVFTPPGMHTRCECVNTRDDRLCDDDCAIPLSDDNNVGPEHPRDDDAGTEPPRDNEAGSVLARRPGPRAPARRDDDDAATAPARRRYGYTAPARRQ